MTIALPDTNVLLALAWPNHQFHAAARLWFSSFGGNWATCTVTQLGFVRLSSNPAFTRHAKTPREALVLLRLMVAHPKHVLLNSDPGLIAESFEAVAQNLQGHKQVTDAYLIFLASESRAQVVTFDHRLAAVTRNSGLLKLLAP